MVQGILPSTRKKINYALFFFILLYGKIHKIYYTFIIRFFLLFNFVSDNICKGCGMETLNGWKRIYDTFIFANIHNIKL
jgi:hypothetical protein